jgi:hypothetical protein
MDVAARTIISVHNSRGKAGRSVRVMIDGCDLGTVLILVLGIDDDGIYKRT